MSMVNLKISYNKYPDREVELTHICDRSELQTINSKDDLLGYLASATKLNITPSNYPHLKYLRKSKKHKSYVALESGNDFKSLARSLNVKNHVKLIINDLTPQSSARFPASTSLHRQLFDFATLGDRIVESMAEHCKDILTEFTKDAFATSNSTPEDPTSNDSKKVESEVVHTNVSCDSCNPYDFAPLEGVRYTCLVCPNLDFCESCSMQSEPMKIGNHSPQHPMARIVSNAKSFNKNSFMQPHGKYTRSTEFNAEEMIHETVSCDSCHPEDLETDVFIPLKGVRYKCLECENFDLCAECVNRQALDKKPIGEHLYSHTVARIADPTVHFHQGPKRFRHGFPPQVPHIPELVWHQHANAFHNHWKKPRSQGDKYYDIPLRNCTADTKKKLESFLNRGGIELFFNNVDSYIKDAERYRELVKISKTNENAIPDNDDEIDFAIIKSLVETSLTSKNSNNEVLINHNSATEVSDNELSNEKPNVEVEFQSENNDFVNEKELNCASAVEFVTVRPKKLGANDKIIALTVVNTSNRIINGGDVKFEFFNDNHKEVVQVKNTPIVKPGQERTYNFFGRLSDYFEGLTDLRLRIVTSKISFEGSYAFTSDSVLKLEQTPVLNAEGDISNEKGNQITSEPTEGFEHILGDEDTVNVTLVPKSRNLSQVIIHNKSNKSIDCSDLKLEIVNCLNTTVVSIIIHKTYGIGPGKTGKFNIGLINTHMKFPFKLVMKNEYNYGSCELSMKNLSGDFNFQKAVPLEDQQTTSFVDIATESETDTHLSTAESDSDLKLSPTVSPTSVTDQATDSNSETEEEEYTETSSASLIENEEEHNSTMSVLGSTRSMLLPSLPKESLVGSNSISEFLDAKSEPDSPINTENSNDEDINYEDEYDIISVGEGDENEIGSDFEMLSPAISNP